MSTKITTLLILLLVVTSIQFSFGQFQKTLIQGRSWITHSCAIDDTGNQLKIDGKDTINNLEYFKLVNFCNSSVFYGHLREDTIQGKIWYIPTYDNIERLWVDLSLEIGDNFDFKNTSGKVSNIEVINGRKHIIFDIKTSNAGCSIASPGNVNLEHIEGFGSIEGFEDFFIPSVVVSSCVNDTFQLSQFPEYDNKCPKCNTSTKDFESEELIKVNVFPNPSNGLIKVEFDNSFQDNPIRFELIDFNGKKLLEKSFNNKSDHVFSIENFSSGIYQWVVYLDKRKYSFGRIVLMN